MDCYMQNQENHRSALRYIRVKDVGTRMASLEQRNKKIVQAAEPLPEGNQLPARVIYWFVTNEEVQIHFSHNKFHWHYSFPVLTEEGTTYYLNQIEFRKSGIVEFGFPDGRREQCYSMAKPSSTKMKITQGNDSDAQLNDESQSPQISVPETPNNNNNTNETFVCDGNGLTRVPYPASRDLIVNILLLVPDMNELVDTLDKELTKIDFKKEVSSINQHLYSRVNSTYKQFHVLVLPYGKLNQYYKVAEYLQYTTEVILMVEDSSQQNGLMAVECVANVNYTPHYTWQFEVKTQSFKKTTLDFATLDPSVTLLFQIEELQRASKGGASCNGGLSLEGLLSRYILEWTLRPVTKSAAQMIYICFKYEPKKVKAFGEYAAASLAALGIEYDFEPLVAHGSVLVYIRCPAYIPWYIMMRKDKVFDTLADLGLTEIYECFISDVDASLQRPQNAKLVAELMFLKEQMISDGIEEQLENRFRAEKNDITYLFSEDSQALTVTISKNYPSEEYWSDQLQDLSKYPKLKELRIENEGTTTVRDFEGVFQAVMHNSSLTQVSFKDQRLGPKKSFMDSYSPLGWVGAERYFPIFNDFVINTTVKYLSLENLAGDCIRPIADALRRNQTLQSLSIKDNSLTKQDLRILYEGLMVNMSLVRLTLPTHLSAESDYKSAMSHVAETKKYQKDSNMLKEFEKRREEHYKIYIELQREQLHGSTMVKPENDPFGKHIEQVANQDGTNIPAIVDKAVEYIENKGLEEEGIFRISASKRDVDQLKGEIAQTGHVDFTGILDPHLVVDILKAYLRELPEPLLTLKAYNRLYVLHRLKELDDFINQSREIFKSLPKVNYATCARLFRLLSKIVENAARNQMRAVPLSTILSPNIFYTYDHILMTGDDMYETFQMEVKLVALWVLNAYKIFN